MNDENLIKCEYKKLLKKGLNNINIGNDASLEDHLLSNEDDLNNIKMINNYVYTTYSTNNGDKTYSLDLFILNKYSQLLISKLISKNYWFVCKDNNKLFINVDNTYNNNKYKDSLTIKRENSLFLDKNYWKELYSDDNLVTFERDADIYFLSDNNIKDFKKNLFLDSNLHELLSFKYYLEEDSIDYDLLMKNVSYFIIEDPIIGRKKLYNELLNILEELVILE
jgi:hypothetical protein